MLLLLSSFIGTLVFYFVAEAIFKINSLSHKLRAAADSSLPLSCYRLEAANIVCSQWISIPVFVRVYIIGVMETIYITLCKRGLFKHSSTQTSNEKQVDTLIHSYTSTKQNTAVITGGDSGIGLEICKGLLEAGFNVIIGTRSVEACQQVLLDLKKATGSDKVSCIELDLTSFKSVLNFVREVKKNVKSRDLQLLINNAGVMNIPCTITKDGFETQCQTNLLSPILLTQSLLPWMDVKDGRVLFASSSTLYAINDLETDFSLKKYGFDGLAHYAYSKACIAQLVPQLSQSTKIKVLAYHPGTVRTRLFSHTTVFSLSFLSKLFDFIMLSPKEGSQTPLHLCLSKNIGPSGSYWANSRIQELPKVLVNGKENNVKALWKDTLIKCGL